MKIGMLWFDDAPHALTAKGFCTGKACASPRRLAALGDTVETTA